jgi:parallel beta-helix repeat protein
LHVSPISGLIAASSLGGDGRGNSTAHHASMEFVMTTTTLSPGTYGPQTMTSGELLLSESGPGTTFIVDTGGFNTIGVFFPVSVTGAQVGDLDGHGFTIEATNPGGTAVEILGSDNTVEGNILSANNPLPNGQGADLVTGGGANDLLIQGNTFEGTGFALAYVNGKLDVNVSSENVNFVNNTFKGTAAAGVDLVDDAASGTISGNSFSGSGDGAIFLGHLSAAAAEFYLGNSGAFETGTITVADNNFKHWTGPDIITFDANYTLVRGRPHQTLTSEVISTGQEIDTLTGVVPGDRIHLNHGVTVTDIQQVTKAEVEVNLSNGDELFLQGQHALNATAVAAAILGINPHTLEPLHVA